MLPKEVGPQAGQPPFLPGLNAGVSRRVLMRICIYGQARTGTTALFLAKQAMLPTEAVCLFEPAAVDIGTLPADCLVKTLVASLPGDEHRLPTQFYGFDRRYVLVRDPRDRLISLLLFLPHWSNAEYPPLWQSASAKLTDYLQLLHRKE